jgi:Arc/MetJ-type ribon-helix-helix transcriptional regulator
VKKMLVSKTVTLDAEDVVEIQKSVDRGQADNASDFVQKAVKMYLNKLKGGITY